MPYYLLFLITISYVWAFASCPCLHFAMQCMTDSFVYYPLPSTSKTQSILHEILMQLVGTAPSLIKCVAVEKDASITLWNSWKNEIDFLSEKCAILFSGCFQAVQPFPKLCLHELSSDFWYRFRTRGREKRELWTKTRSVKPARLYATSSREKRPSFETCWLNWSKPSINEKSKIYPVRPIDFPWIIRYERLFTQFIRCDRLISSESLFLSVMVIRSTIYSESPVFADNYLLSVTADYCICTCIVRIWLLELKHNSKFVDAFVMNKNLEWETRAVSMGLLPLSVNKIV